MDHREEYIKKLADAVLGGEGSLERAMIENVEALSLEVYNLAPREFNDLRASGHPSVDDDGVPVYDRAPYVHRLTSEELEAKSELKEMGFGTGGRYG